MEYTVSNTLRIRSDYTTISDAVCEAEKHPGEKTVIRIYPGIYNERVEIRKTDVELIGMGDSPEDVLINCDYHALEILDDGKKRGTFRTYTVLADGAGIKIKNLTIENSSPDESVCGQAIALYAEGEGIEVEGCRLLGRQDTLFTGPLPEKEIEPGGFIGPKQFSPRINGHQYYHGCYICGNVDFIFGSASVLFEDCTIESLTRASGTTGVQGYVAAPSTPAGQEEGYIFRNCSFVSSKCPAESVFLARPWRDYAKCVFENCEFGEHIKTEGFDDWGKALAREVSFFSVKDCKRSDGSPYAPTAPFAVTIHGSSECCIK